MINNLIESNIEFASKIASIFKKKLPKSVDYDDLKSCAYYGLVKAANKYDATLGNFKTYAYYRMVGEIKDFLRKFYHKSFESLEDTENLIASKTSSSGELLEKFQRILSPMSVSVLKSYFYDDKSLKEIGDSLNLSESRICQVISNSKAIIKKEFEKEELWSELHAA